jgi:hypothetical protein
MMNNKIGLAFNALNLIYSVTNSTSEELKLNNQNTFNSSIIDYSILKERLIKKDYISKSLNKTYSNFEDYDIELNILIQKNNDDLYELFKSFTFQIFDKEIIQFYSKKYKLIIFNKCPLSLVIDKFIISKFCLENSFTFILEDNLEFEVMKSPKWFIIMSTEAEVLFKYKEYGSWTVFLTFPYLNLSENEKNIVNLIESNNQILKKYNASLIEIFDLTSISFFNQEYFFDLIKEINETPLPFIVNESKDSLISKEVIYEEHLLISKEYAKNLEENQSCNRKSRKDKSSSSLAVTDEANKTLFKKKVKELNCKKILVLSSVLVKPAAFNKSLFFISSDKLMYIFYYPSERETLFNNIEIQLIGVRFNELQQVYYYKDILDSLSKINTNKLTCRVENIKEVLSRKNFNKFLYEGFINYLKEKYFTKSKELLDSNNRNNILANSKALYNNNSFSKITSSTLNEKTIKQKLSLLKSIKKICVKCNDFLNINNISKFEAKLSVEPFNNFFLVKFDSSKNIDMNHLVYIVVNKSGFSVLLEELKLLVIKCNNDLDIIFEPYLAHDSYFIKANVLYGEPKIIVKKSFPLNIKEIIEEKYKGILKFNTSDIDKLIVDFQKENIRLDTNILSHQQKLYDEELVRLLIDDFIEFSKLTFIGFDFIVTDNFNHYIIDINYFPSYSERGSLVGDEIRKHFEYIYFLNNKKFIT